jgi:hypothetical protein
VCLPGLIVGKNSIVVEGFKLCEEKKKMEEYLFKSEFFEKKIEEE